MTDRSARARKMTDASDAYTAADIEVLEGLEPVRRRPGMYIGGTDEKALHHLFAEVIDNSMDEAVAGHATWIEVRYEADGFLSVMRQRPRHSGRSAPQVQEPVGARSDHDARCIRAASSTARPTRPRAACTASACRWSTRCPRRARSRSRAASSSIAWCSIAALRPAKLAEARPDDEPARHQGPLPAGREDLRQGLRLQAGATADDGALEGLSVRRRRDPLVLRRRA